MKIKASICQLKVSKEKDFNLDNAAKMIKKASENGSDLIVLPEMFNCPYENDYFISLAETYPDKTTNMLSDIARKLGVYVVGGSIPEKDGEKIYNTSYTFDRKGNLITKYRKTHLFYIKMDNGIVFKENNTISAGNSISVFETEFCKIGIAICYDLRFPELMRKITLEGAKVIIAPAAFNMITGPAHWHTLILARAIDNQVYFLAASSAKNLKVKYVAYGHSMIVDPWGDVLAEAGEGEEIISANLDLEKLEKVRKEFPLLSRRRDDLY